MGNFETLFKEVELLQEDIKKYNKGLIPYNDINERLNNISVLVEYLLEYNDYRG